MPIRRHYGGTISPESVDADSMRIGVSGGDRPLKTTERTVIRTSNYSSWANVRDDIPWFIYHSLEIVHDDATVNGQFTVPPIVAADYEPDGSGLTLQLKGSDSTPSNWPIEGLKFESLVAKRFTVKSVEFTGINSESDSASLENTGPGVVVVNNINFTNANGASSARAMSCYGGHIIVKNSIGDASLGTDNYQDGIVVKNQGSFQDSTIGGGISGSVTDRVIWEQSALGISWNVQSTLSGPTYLKQDKSRQFSQYDRSELPSGPLPTIEVSSGSIPAVFDVAKIQGSGGSSDTITDITDGYGGQRITLLRATSDVTLDHNAGNLRIGSNFVLDTANAAIQLVYDSGVWECLSRRKN